MEKLHVIFVYMQQKAENIFFPLTQQRFMKGCNMSLLTYIWNAILISFVEIIYLVGVLIAIGFLLGILEKQAQSYITRTFGRRGILVTAWIGTPIHEFGHLIQCIIWRHKIKKVKFLQTSDPNGVLGYVQHQYNTKSVYQQIGNFFIGIGPIISGIGTIILAMYFLVPQSFTALQLYIEHSVGKSEKIDIQLFQTLWEAVAVMSKSLFTITNFSEPAFWIFVILAISISSHIALSKPDIESSYQGLLTIFSILLLFHLAAGLFGLDTYRVVQQFTAYNAYLLAFSSIAVLFSLLSLAVSYVLYKIIK
jgi:hypothetical protein